MRRTRLAEPGPQSASHTDHPLLRLLAQGALVELIWGLGLLVVLAFVSLAIWALLDTVGTM
jgi:hypothetical protein